MELPVKPRVLIADDSRIVRATLIKHIEGMFDFKEALDGEQAWEALLLDPGIRVVITDLTMPRLDGYGLLKRIRESKISRIRTIPVVVVSGSDEQEERDRAKAAGATDLITKGIGTAQLLSRLDILSKLVSTQHEFERGLEALVQNAGDADRLPLASPEEMASQAAAMLDSATRQGRNFVLLTACVGLKSASAASASGAPALPPAAVVDAIGQLLRRTVRQTDCVSRTGEAEFTLATGSIHFDSARHFAQRICGAIASADLMEEAGMPLVASCGMVALAEFGRDTTSMDFSVSSLHALACRRARMGLDHGMTGVVGPVEEAALLAGLPVADSAQRNPAGTHLPDMATLLQWVREGKSEQVLQQLGQHGAELRPLLELLLRQPKST